MSFLIKDDNLLKKYNDIWNKVINSIKKELDCDPSTIFFRKPKQGLMAMRLEIFMLQKHLNQTLILFVV